MAWFEKDDGEEFKIAGVELKCEICKHGRFGHRKAQLNTAVASFFGVDWANPAADCYVCCKCGYIHWFLPRS